VKNGIQTRCSALTKKMKNYLTILILIFFLSCSNQPKKEKIIVSQSFESSTAESSVESDCVFETNLNKKCWTRVGVYPIDSIAEKFACNLKDKGLKHILVAKYIGDNGAFPNESAFILWTESNKEFVKEFYTSGSLEVEEKAIKELNWKSLRVIANTTKLDTVSSRPKLKLMMSHNIGLAVQYEGINMFVCERLQDIEWKSAIDKNHPKVIFWKELTRLLEPTTER